MMGLEFPALTYLPCNMQHNYNNNNKKKEEEEEEEEENSLKIFYCNFIAQSLLHRDLRDTFNILTCM